MTEERTSEERTPDAASTKPAVEDAASTVGTGSVLGIGCLLVVVVLVALAIAYRLFGGSW
jgi:hypothetical protein